MCGRPQTEETRKKISASMTLKIDETMNKEFAYLLGVILGDGCWYGRRGRYYRIQIAPGLDESFADECVLLLSRLGLHPRKDLKPARKPQHNPQWLVEVNSKALYDSLKSLTLESLKQIMWANELRLAFWRGFARAEGYRTETTLQISNADGELIEWGRQFMLDLGLRPRLYKCNYKDSRKPTYSLRLHGRDQVAFFLSYPKERITAGADVR